MSYQAEQGVLYSLLRNNSGIQACDLEPHEFETWHHQELYSAIQYLVNENQIADYVTVCDLLERRSPGQEFLPYIKRLVENGVQGASLEQYTRIIRNAHRKQQALAIATTLQQGLNAGEHETAVDNAIQQLMSLNTVGRNYDHDMRGLMGAAVKMINQAVESDGLTGINTGLADLNDSLGGFQKSDLVIMGARPSMGKTALMLNLALAANASVGIISAEQGHEQMGGRLISIEGRIDSQKIRTGGFYDTEWDSLGMTVARLTDKPIRLNDEPGITIAKVVRQARDWKFKYNIEALYVDYLQKIKAPDPRTKKHEQVGEVAASLKNLAKELKIPVIALAQVNRECEKRPNKRPLMSDLADASEIEKEADEILFLYRDEVYNENTDDKGIAEIDISKNRHGPIGLVRCAFTGKFMRFDEISARRYQDTLGGSA